MLIFSVALGFTYENKSYGNNSVILIHHCDYYNFQPLIRCITDNSSFYSQTDGYSDWYNPSGRRVSDLPYRNYNIRSSQQCFAQYNHSYNSPYALTHSNLVYTLGESSSGSENCYGLYQCLIPDRYGELQQLFLGIYIDDIRKCL